MYYTNNDPKINQCILKKNISPEIQNNKQNDNIFFSYSNVIPNSQTESFEKNSILFQIFDSTISLSLPEYT